MFLQAIALSIFCYSTPGLVAAFQEYKTEGLQYIGELYIFIMASVVIGGFAYGCKLPERWAPGHFDIIGKSLGCLPF